MGWLNGRRLRLRKENMIGYSSIHNNLKAMCGKYFIDYYLTNKNVDVNKMKIQKANLSKLTFKD